MSSYNVLHSRLYSLDFKLNSQNFDVDPGSSSLMVGTLQNNFLIIEEQNNNNNNKLFKH